MGKAREWMVRGPFSSGLYELVPAQDVLIASKDCLFVREVLDTSPDHVASEDKQGAEDAWKEYADANPPKGQATLYYRDNAEYFKAGYAYAERKAREAGEASERSAIERVVEFLKRYRADHGFPSYTGEQWAQAIERRFLKEQK